MVRLGVAALLALFSSACGSKGAVALLATAESPSLTVEQAALGASLSGGFQLVLELGEYAEDGTDVSLASFGLYRDSEEIVSTLPLSANADFPQHLEPGDGRSITLSIDMGGDLLDSAVGEALCAGEVLYRGGVTEGDGALTPASSLKFSPSCP